MKKGFSLFQSLILVCIILLGVAFSVSAAGSAHMSIQSSSANVYRGDSFTLSINLSNDQLISNGGIILSYDSSVFEILGGSCHITSSAEVSAANGGGVFALYPDSVVSGAIFTINMRVKENAAFGSYNLSGTPSLSSKANPSIPCSISGTSISVRCRHNYANCTNVNETSHESTCTICTEKKTESHTWDAGTVLKSATCKETGSKKLTCTGCGATKTETIPLSNSHEYGKWNNGGSNHNRTCSVCGKKETAAHTWNNGTVITAATCTATGSKKQTCTGCGATQTATVPKTAHAYAEAVYVDEATHKQVCKDCQHVSQQNHQYDDAWVHDENWHFLRCGGCGHEKEQAAHTPGPEATETTDQICTVCNRILQPRGEHEHSFAEAWSTDETGHWHACASCNEKDSAAPHVFDDDCDSTCDICLLEREPAHAPAQAWSSDETGHWYACAACGGQVSFSPHTPGPVATITSAQSCTQCHFEIASVLPHDHVFDTNGTQHTHSCACGEIYSATAKDCQVCAQFPWWIVCVAEAVVFGVVIVLLIVKKRRPGQ